MLQSGRLDIVRAQQILRSYNTVAIYTASGWDIRGDLVDECVYARLSADADNKFCLVTAALTWEKNEVTLMLEAVDKINKCLTELAEVNPELVK
jgi:hypothetical protein